MCYHYSLSAHASLSAPESTYYIFTLLAAGIIHNPQHYTRDFYFFKRSQYPQLSLVHKEPSQAYNELQTQCFGLKFVEIGKVMLTWGILKNVSQVVQRVVFLHEDLMKLPSFPRKALEAELDLHANGEIGKVSPRLLIRQQNFLPFFANQN